MQFQKKLTIISCFILALGLAACSQANLTNKIIEDQWGQSAHNDSASKSFTHWDNENPPVIPEQCAKCHSTFGYLNFLGEDGSTPGQVDMPSPVGTTIECDVCHTSIAVSRDFAVKPSGAMITRLGQESNCMECHQGRASSKQILEAIAGLPVDTVNAGLSLPNPHNNAAGATFYGTTAQGGGEYAHQVYITKFYHGFDSCITCHDSHTLEVNVENCSACHLGATTIEGVRNIRLSKIDYDGDGDISEGLSGEIETMQEKLLTMIRLYAATTEDVDLIEYRGLFVHENGEEYATWTPRLLQAAYNYEFVVKDPGSYSHNPKYIMQLLYDSIENLGGDTRGMSRP